MKSLIIILSLISVNAFASGKVILERAHKFNQERYHSDVTAIGLSAYEKIVGNLNYEFYTGVGQQDILTSGTKQDYWFATKVDLGYKMKNFTISMGATMKLLTDDFRSNNDVHMSIGYIIW